MSTEAKKVFISYSWKVQEKVIELTERLISNGIDVILDVYDLKEGQDKYAFMEQSVNDPSVDKVLIICDRSYMEKANDRSGGVGDETVIISPEIYGQMKQEKFIPMMNRCCTPCMWISHFLTLRPYRRSLGSIALIRRSMIPLFWTSPMIQPRLWRLFLGTTAPHCCRMKLIPTNSMT